MAKEFYDGSGRMRKRDPDEEKGYSALLVVLQFLALPFMLVGALLFGNPKKKH